MQQAKKYLKISWGMTLIILIMWLLADVGIFKEQSITWDDELVSLISADNCLYYVIETHYGLGKNLYYDPILDVVTDTVEFKIEDDIWANICTVHTWELFYNHRSWWARWARQLPGFKLGWLLVAIFVLIYIFLIRRVAKTTNSFARPIRNDRPKILHKFYPEKRPKFEKTRILVKPEIVYALIIVSLFFSLFIIVADFYLVYNIGIVKYYDFTTYTQIDTSFRNFEYILPSIVYLVASVISSICIVKYIKAVKNDASKTNDVSLN